MFSNKCSIHVETCKRMLRLVVTVNFMWLFCASEPKAVSLARYITRPSCRVKPLKVDVELTASSLSHCTMMCKDTSSCITASWNSGRYNLNFWQTYSIWVPSFTLPFSYLEKMLQTNPSFWLRERLRNLRNKILQLMITIKILHLW